MKASILLKKLEKKRIISRSPHPLLPFILAGISLILSYITFDEIFQKLLIYLTIFTTVFAIIHLIIVIILKK